MTDSPITIPIEELFQQVSTPFSELGEPAEEVGSTWPLSPTQPFTSRFLNTKSMFYLSAACGLGKTRAACEFIKRNRNKANFLYVAPTLKLLSQVENQLREQDVNTLRVASDGTHAREEWIKQGPSRSVVNDIVEALSKAPETGAVLLVTWNAYERLPFFPNASRWLRIIDEVPQIDRVRSLNVPISSEILKQNLEVQKTHGDAIGLVRAASAARLKKLLSGPKDDTVEIFRSVFQDALSANIDVFVDLPTWDRVVDRGMATKGSDEANRVYFLSMLRPGLLEGSILLGAHLEKSMLWDWMVRWHGRSFTSVPELDKMLDSQRDLSKRVEIMHFGAQALYSKYVANRKSESEETSQMIIEKAAIDAFGGEQFIFALNKNADESRLVEAGGLRVPAMAHGLNDFSKFRNVLFGAALQREPKHQKMLAMLGFDRTRVDNPTLETIYQVVMRTSLRNPASTDVVRVIVPDIPSAEYLGNAFGNAKLSQIGCLAPARRSQKRNSGRLTQTEKNQRVLAKRIKDRIFMKSVPDSLDKDNGTENSGEGIFPTVRVTFHVDVKAATSEEHAVECFSIGQFIKELRVMSRNVVERKDHSFLFNAASFNPPEGASGFRRVEYFQSSAFMILDFDGGTVSPEEFIRAFWHDAGSTLKRSFVVMNSFSRTANNPNKFRVIMFYKEPAATIDLITHHRKPSWRHRDLQDCVRIEGVGHGAQSHPVSEGSL